MRCPSCGATEDRVVDSRETEDGSAIRRRRECSSCHGRFSTIERLSGAPPLSVLKRSGEREPFQRQKMVQGIAAACKNRPVRPEQVSALAADIEEQLRRSGPVVASERVGLAVLDRLRELDEVAYLRFASVYKGFDSAVDFAREVGLLAKQTAPKRRVGAAVPTGGSGAQARD